MAGSLAAMAAQPANWQVNGLSSQLIFLECTPENQPLLCQCFVSDSVYLSLSGLNYLGDGRIVLRSRAYLSRLQKIRGFHGSECYDKKLCL